MVYVFIFIHYETASGFDSIDYKWGLPNKPLSLCFQLVPKINEYLLKIIFDMHGTACEYSARIDYNIFEYFHLLIIDLYIDLYTLISKFIKYYCLLRKAYKNFMI